MKIIVTASGSATTDAIDMRFGRAQYFLLVDEKGKILQVIDNAAKREGSGAGVMAAQTVLDTGAEAIITGHLGPNALRVIQGAKLPAYQAIEGTVSDNLAAFAENKLKSLTSTD